MVYDESANLTKMQGHTTLAYSYDATGRVVKKQNQTEQKETSYTYSPSGALLEAGTQHFSYNAAGNQTQNEQSYNSLNQLLEDRDYLYAYVPQGNRGNRGQVNVIVPKAKTSYTPKK